MYISLQRNLIITNNQKLILQMSLLKKAFHTSVGFATTTTETLKTRYKDVYTTVEKQQETKEKKGEKFVATIQKDVETKYKEVRSNITGRVNETVDGFAGQLNATMDKFNIPTTEVFRVVEKRMKTLEKKVSDLSKELEARQN